MLKFISENKVKSIIASENFLFLSCSIIFLFSIFLRSTIDIGSDTGVYINLAKKISKGGRYYYDFFESNFPLSFYFYLLEYYTTKTLHLNPIILSEITINLLALASIFWSTKILQISTISENKAHYNLIIFSYFLGFFLRPNALQIGEFGTKTSLLLILLYPYISFSFARKNPFSKKELIYRGSLMGLIPCLKPHYLVLIIFVEAYKFFQQKKIRFFLELDKLIMLLIGALYLFLMLKFTPEFFEFIVPMWPKIYPAYDDPKVFFNNSLRHLAARIGVFIFIFLIFSRLKFEYNDKILALFFAAASVLLVLESIASVDQIVIFYAIVTICFSKFLYALFSSGKFLISENKFVICCLIFLPLFDLEIFPAAIFGLGGVINAWWVIALIYPFFLAKKNHQNFFGRKKISVFIFVYLLLASCAFLILRNIGGWAYIAFNLLVLFAILLFFERKIYSKISANFSPFFVFVVIASFSCLFYSYFTSIVEVFRRNHHFTTPSKLTDAMAYYTKTYAPQKEDTIMVVSIWIAHKFPLINYLQKENYQKFHIAATQADRGKAGSTRIFSTKDKDTIFTLSYLLEDVKTQLKNPRTKVIFLNNSPEIIIKGTNCLISTLEYYFLDPEFKKIFLQNFRFENHLIITEKIVPTKKVRFITGEEPSIFDKVGPSTKRVLYDFEVYVRKDEKN